MKCDNLKVRTVYVDWKGGDICYYDPYEVDAAIDELKTEHHKERHEYIEMVALLRRENAELKAKLNESEEARYEAGADAADYYQDNRRLKRALWLARSYRSRDNSILLPSKFMRNVWDNVERKCLKKAEQYK